MRELTSREFRAEWTKLTGEVVAVTAHGRVLGHWVPGDNPLRWEGPEPDGAITTETGAKSLAPAKTPARDFKPPILPPEVKKSLDETGSPRPFHPVPKPGSKK